MNVYLHQRLGKVVILSFLAVFTFGAQAQAKPASEERQSLTGTVNQPVTCTVQASQNAAVLKLDVSPNNGAVEITPLKSGQYQIRYTPKGDFAGKDSFVLRPTCESTSLQPQEIIVIDVIIGG